MIHQTLLHISILQILKKKPLLYSSLLLIAHGHHSDANLNTEVANDEYRSLKLNDCIRQIMTLKKGKAHQKSNSQLL